MTTMTTVIMMGKKNEIVMLNWVGQGVRGELPDPDQAQAGPTQPQDSGASL